jgi:uncharacterized protein YceK
MRCLVVLATACVLLSGCSTRALRAPDDLWDAPDGADGASFLADHGRWERPASALD